jgi:hypothetical protein
MRRRAGTAALSFSSPGYLQLLDSGLGEVPARAENGQVVVRSFVTGVLDLQAREDDSGATVSAGPYSTTTAPDGSYTLLLPPGSHQVTASLEDYLPASKAGVVVGAEEGSSLHYLRLRSGNLLNAGGSYNYISVADTDLVLAYFAAPRRGRPGEDSYRADITLDGFVDVYDLVAVTSNWHMRASDYGW